MAEQRTADVTAGPGGVMTDEVGVVTGDLTIRAELDDSLKYVAKVQYKDADEWYTITGSGRSLGNAGELDAALAAEVEKAKQGGGSGQA